MTKVGRIVTKSFITISLLIILAACNNDNTSSNSTSNNNSEDSEVKTIKVANIFGEDHFVNVALREHFKPMVEESSNGSLEVEIYPNSQLGTEDAILSSLRSGTIQMAYNGTVM